MCWYLVMTNNLVICHVGWSSRWREACRWCFLEAQIALLLKNSAGETLAVWKPLGTLSVQHSCCHSLSLPLVAVIQTSWLGCHLLICLCRLCGGATSRWWLPGSTSVSPENCGHPAASWETLEKSQLIWWTVEVGVWYPKFRRRPFGQGLRTWTVRKKRMKQGGSGHDARVSVLLCGFPPAARLKDPEYNETRLLKLKDWPTREDFCDKLPLR